MPKHCLHTLLLLGLFSALATVHAQTRVPFPRQKFDRSRFERAGSETTPPPPPPVPSTPLPPPPPQPTSPPPPGRMVTEIPASATPVVPASALSTSPLPALPSATFPTTPYGLTPEEKAVYDAPLFDQIPTRWFNDAKDHEPLLALQKQTGTCLLIYFKNELDSGQKGLCNWFERRITTDMQWRKAMKYYLKLEVLLSGRPAVEQLAARYRVQKTPALFVLKPGSSPPTRINVFDYTPGLRPEPRSIEQILDSLKAASTPAYQNLF